MQSRKAVSVYFTSKQILLFGLAEQNSRDQQDKGKFKCQQVLCLSFGPQNTTTGHPTMQIVIPMDRRCSHKLLSDIPACHILIINVFTTRFGSTFMANFLAACFSPVSCWLNIETTVGGCLVLVGLSVVMPLFTIHD